MLTISIQTPSEINKKISAMKKRKSCDDYSPHRPLASAALSNSSNKRPCHHRGTIYEKRLMPMPAATVLPVPFAATIPNAGRLPVDRRLQTRFLQLVDHDDDNVSGEDNCAMNACDRLREFLAENSDRVDVNEYGEDGVTPLQRLCQTGGGDVEVARTLVCFGADPRMTSRDGWSAFHMASFSGNTKLMRYLLSLRSS